ncbi:collagen-like protein [Streptomyces noursei]|uniref:collagen-like triple helix repeat-containing protein n=1 Tax=Streptomyces noursei TaxID=1971 RepID=UPI0033F36574
MADVTNVNFTNGAKYAAKDFRRMFGSMMDFTKGIETQESFYVDPHVDATNTVLISPGRAWVKDNNKDNRQGLIWIERTEPKQFTLNTTANSGFIVLQVQSPEFSGLDKPVDIVPQVVASLADAKDGSLVLARFTRPTPSTWEIQDYRLHPQTDQYLVTKTGPAREGTPPPAPTADAAKRSFFRPGTQYMDLMTGSRWMLQGDYKWVRDGSSIRQGTETPPVDAYDGNFYIQCTHTPNPNTNNSFNYELFERKTGKWVTMGVLSGDKWYANSSNPTDSEGSAGDMYLHTGTGAVWQKQYINDESRPAGSEPVVAWVELAGLMGPQGPRGDVGPIGPVGPQGLKGDQGEKGEKGDLKSLEGYTGNIRIQGDGRLYVGERDVINEVSAAADQGKQAIARAAEAASTADVLKKATEALAGEVNRNKAEVSKLNTRVGNVEQKASFFSRGVFKSVTVGAAWKVVPFKQKWYAEESDFDRNAGVAKARVSGMYQVMCTVNGVTKYPRSGTFFVELKRKADNHIVTGQSYSTHEQNIEWRVSCSGLVYLGAGDGVYAYVRSVGGDATVTEDVSSGISLVQVP